MDKNCVSYKLDGAILMITINDFIEEELNKEIQNSILETINNSIKQEKKKEELIFNRYSLEIYFSNNEVFIYDDIFSEDNPPLKISLDKFINAITKY
jgi:hypothetical protein